MILESLEDIFCRPRLDDPASPVLKFTTGAELVIRDTYEGIALIGATASGKTSAALTIKKSLLRHGYGLYIGCVKDGEGEEWQKIVAEAGRSHDFIRFQKGSGYRFNPFEHETNPAEAVALLQEMMALLNGNEKNNPGSIFWNTESGKVVGHGFNIGFHAFGRMDWVSASKICKDFALSLEQVDSKSWQARSFNYQAVKEAERLFPHSSEVKRSSDFWFKTFPSYDPRTRANVMAVVGNLLDRLEQEPFVSLFSGVSNCTPMDILNHRKIICCDLPVLTDRMTGTLANSIWLYSMCRAIPKRKSASPAAIYIDEAQFLLSDEMMLLQTVIRSHSVATILLFQNLSVLQERLSKASVTALLGNINTLILTRQSDAETRQWAADRVGKQKCVKETKSRGTSPGRLGTSSTTLSKVEVLDYKFQPDDFYHLSTGGHKNRCKVESIVVAGTQAFRADWHQVTPGSIGTVKPV
jgi:hypothetical protein